MAAEREELTGSTAGEPPPRHASPFEMTDWSAMDAAVRVEYCQLMAEEGLLLARSASDELKEGYLDLAACWLELATELARTGARPASVATPPG